MVARHLCYGLWVFVLTAGAALAEMPSSPEPIREPERSLENPELIKEAGAVPDSQEQLLQQIEQYNPVNLSLQGQDPLERVNSVLDLADVFPTDWAYTALEQLADRYGCVLAYGDGTYRGNRAMTRYEFAANLDACLEAIQVQIDQGSSEIASSDLQILRQLQDQFATDLATLRARVSTRAKLIVHFSQSRASHRIGGVWYITG